MADLSTLGLTTEDLKSAKAESAARKLDIMGLTPEDLGAAPTGLVAPESTGMPGGAPGGLPAIPAAPSAPGDIDLPLRALAPQEAATLQGGGRPAQEPSPTAGALPEPVGQIVDMAAAFNRGIVGTVDLPVTLFNIGAQAFGSKTRAAGLGDIPAVRQATQGGFGPSGVLPEALELGAEFFSGGGAIQGAAKAVAKGAQGFRSPVIQRAAEEIGKVQLATDIRAAAGGGLASSAVNHSEILSDSVAAQLLAPILGGVAGAASGPLLTRAAKGLPGGQKKTRAAQVIVAAADDPDAAVQELAKQEFIDIGAAAQTGDVGVMTLARSLARENPVFEGRLNDQYVMSQRAIQAEIDNLFTPDGRPRSPTAAQDFIKQNSSELIRQLDDRATVALEAVQSVARLGRGQIDDITISRNAKVRLEKALRVVGTQGDVLWKQVGREVPVDTGPLQTAARQIVEESNKASQLPVKTLEMILGKQIEKTPTGYQVSGKAVSGGFDATEPVGTLMTLRSNLLAELRAESKDAISTVQAPILNRLQGAAIDAIDNNPLPSGVDESAYRVAAAYTRRMHEVFDQGLIGRVLTSNTKGGEAVLSEKTLSTLLGGGREAQASGARELIQVAQMQEQAGGTPLYKSDLLRGAQEYIAAKFQRQVKNPEDAANFMLENEEAIKRFPKLRQTLTEAMRAIGVQSGKLGAIEAGKAAIEKSAFTKLAGMKGATAVNTILSQRDPARFSKQLRLLVGRDAEALRGMQREIADMVLERSMRTAQAIPQLDEKAVSGALFKVTKKLSPVIDSFYTSEMKGNLAIIQREIANLDALQARTPRKISIPRNMMTDLLARTIGAHAGASLAGGMSTSLIAAKAGSEAGRSLVFAIPERATKAVIEEAMLDRQLLSQLLKRGMKVGKEHDALANALKVTIRQSVGAQAAQEFQNNVEELTNNTPGGP